MDTPHDPPRSNALCPSCGASLPPEASSCVVCGHPITQAPSPSALASPAEPAEPAEPADAIGAATVETLAPMAATLRTQPPAEAPAELEPMRAAADTAESADAAATENAPPGSLRICDWCGAANPVTAARCEKCGASFPRPEQDDLLTRASAERVRLALNEIEMHERLRTPWWKRLFGGTTT